MPMFYTPKPRQFHYNPRYYDPEKEKWEAIKKKYNYSEEDHPTSSDSETVTADNAELAYFENRVREIEREERRESARFGIKDLFRKREMPQFHYTARFNSDGTPVESSPLAEKKPKSKIKIARRFDFDDDEYMQPMSAGKVMIYALIVCAMLFWVFF